MADLIKSGALQDEKSSHPTAPNNIFTYFAYFNIIKLKSLSENLVHDDYISVERQRLICINKRTNLICMHGHQLSVPKSKIFFGIK